jgi:2-polyprenyl-3-methyl-5-hydroxy-6-metoxy-1,4-benzoquinol methylase
MDALHIAWEETTCPLCAGRGATTLITPTDLPCRVVRCRRCSLAYTNPRPSPASIGALYPDSYAPHKPRSKASRGGLADVLPAPGRLLDFGCGAGTLLAQLHRRGWQVVGMDQSPRAARDVRERLGLVAIEGTLPHPDLAPASFDAITMVEALEHVHGPLTVLRAARELLRPGGTLVVSVPNLDSLSFQWFGAAWIGLDLPRHLTHFEPLTLVRMLEHAELKVDQLRPIRHNSWLRRTARAATSWRRLLRHRLPASVAGWYAALRMRGNGIMAVARRSV